MPMHDWMRVEPAIFHDLHHGWISSICRALNTHLPRSHYAMIEPHSLAVSSPTPQLGETTDAEFYLRKKSSVVVRHVSGDRIVAIVEIVSPGNRNVSGAVRAFVDKVWDLLKQKIHLLIIDPFPPDKRTPHGLHAKIFEEIEDQPEKMPPDKPLSLIAYECRDKIQVYFEPIAVGDALVDMPVFLSPPDEFVEVPLEETYQAAWETVPRRWQQVIAPTSAER